MNSSQFISKIAFFYKEPLALEKNGKMVQNPRLTDTHLWVTNNFPDDYDFEKLYMKTIEIFGPKITEPFPMPVSIKKAWDSLPRENTKYIPFDERDMSEAYAVESGVKRGPAPGISTDISVMLEEDSKLSALDMLHKFGLDACSRLWKLQGEYEYTKI